MVRIFVSPASKKEWKKELTRAEEISTIKSGARWLSEEEIIMGRYLALIVLGFFAGVWAMPFLFFPPEVWERIESAGSVLVWLAIPIAGFFLFRHWRQYRRRKQEKITRALKSRPRCPFYGFIRTSSNMVENLEGGCALVCVGRHTPCMMELEGKMPDWNACKHFNIPENHIAVARILDASSAFPKELRPAKKKPWHGISARHWFQLVVGRDHAF